MGLFDDVTCLYPLPWPEAKDGLFQSKCTPAQYLEKYEIRENGELWYRKVHREWRDDPRNQVFGGGYHEVSSEWVRESITGEIEIHGMHNVDGVNYWYSAQFWFRDGVVKDAVFDKRESSGQQTEAPSWPAPPLKGKAEA